MYEKDDLSRSLSKEQSLSSLVGPYDLTLPKKTLVNKERTLIDSVLLSPIIIS